MKIRGEALREWEHEVLMFIDKAGLDYSYDYFLWLVNNAAWCPKCDEVWTDGGALHHGSDVICDECDGCVEVRA